jgi:hypothetical protein
MSPSGGFSHHLPQDLPAIFPDWSPYPDLESAARAYLRDPDLALEAVSGVLMGASVLTFTLERFVNEVNGVWQEVALCDGTRLILWHGEDVAAGEGPPGSMTSSIRVLPLSAVTEVGTRRRLQRSADGQLSVDAVDVYVLLSSFDEGAAEGPDDPGPGRRQDALRFVKTVDDGGLGQIKRLEEFARTVSSMVGRPL